MVKIVSNLRHCRLKGDTIDVISPVETTACDIFLVNKQPMDEKNMRKNQRQSAPSKDLTVKALMADVFGLNRSEARSRKEIPWQWALWGALLFFCVGFLVPTESLWIILLAVGVAVIIYFARASETVEPQVFLLTDNRTEQQKADFERRTNKARPRRPARPKTDKTEKAEKSAEDPKETVKPARPPRKPKAIKPEVKQTAEVETKASVESPVVATTEVAVEVKTTPEPQPEVAKEEAKPKAKPRARRPRTNANSAPRKSAPRRPSKPKAQPALTTAPVSSDK